MKKYLFILLVFASCSKEISVVSTEPVKKGGNKNVVVETALTNLPIDIPVPDSLDVYEWIRTLVSWGTFDGTQIIAEGGAMVYQSDFAPNYVLQFTNAAPWNNITSGTKDVFIKNYIRNRLTGEVKSIGYPRILGVNF